jgi:hypothetical protein
MDGASPARRAIAIGSPRADTVGQEARPPDDVGADPAHEGRGRPGRRDRGRAAVPRRGPRAGRALPDDDPCHSGEDLGTWIGDALQSPLASFTTGIRADRKAVAAAIVEPWSNGQTEGRITKLKAVKRQMFGRAKLDLRWARLIVAD